jgi:hypothetical protein
MYRIMLAIAATLAIVSGDARAETRATPLQTAQRIEALTGGGYDDPTDSRGAANAADHYQRDARLR